MSTLSSFSAQPHWLGAPAGEGREGQGVLTFSLSLLAGLQTDPEAGKHYSTEESESVVGETH